LPKLWQHYEGQSTIINTMKTPPFLLGATLLFWGWQTGLYIFAIIMALILEGARVVQIRWDFSLADLKRVADLCSLIFIGILAYRYIFLRFRREVLKKNVIFESFPHRSELCFLVSNFLPLQWLPLAIFPLIAAQEYSFVNEIDLQVLFLMLRRKRGTTADQSPRTLNLAYPYWAICLLAAGAANVRTNSFYIGVVLLSTLAFWWLRCKRYSPVVWLGVLVIAGIGGYFGHVKLSEIQQTLEQNGALLRLFGLVQQGDADPYQSNTAIGDIGTVKLSNQVLFRAKSDTQMYSSLLLREASYDTYRISKWHAARSVFTDIEAENDETTWRLQSDSISPRSNSFLQITVSSYLSAGQGMLKLPIGTLQLQHLSADILKMNQFAALKVDSEFNLISYQVLFDLDTALDGPPTKHDLVVPKTEQPVFSQLVKDLHLRSISKEDVLQYVMRFFRTQFSYSLTLNRQSQQHTPVADFLLKTRSGHCEYFATATVLLLRAAGIPARYVAGYSTDCVDNTGRWTLVRGRDAHAWALAYIDGRWRDVDTTPPDWRQIEEQNVSLFEFFSDFWARINFAFSEWRQRETSQEFRRYLALLLVPLFAILGWRLFSRRRIKRMVKELEEHTEREEFPGADSAFYQIEQQLQDMGLTRYAWEPLSLWLQRIEKQRSAADLQVLQPILDLHNRYRFDPEGLEDSEKETLQDLFQECLILNHIHTSQYQYRNCVDHLLVSHWFFGFCGKLACMAGNAFFANGKTRMNCGTHVAHISGINRTASFS